MVKPNRTFTLPELKAYVREKKLNKPEIKLSMKKADLVAGLKKHGHWDNKADARIELRRRRRNRRKRRELLMLRILNQRQLNQKQRRQNLKVKYIMLDMTDSVMRSSI